MKINLRKLKGLTFTDLEALCGLRGYSIRKVTDDFVEIGYDEATVRYEQGV